MRKFFKLIFKLVVLALFVFLFTAVWIVLDGTIDGGGKADAALVPGRSESPGAGAEQPQLDRAVKLYNEGKFPFIIVSGSALHMSRGNYDDPAAMAQYLESNGVPSSAIIQDRQPEDLQEMAHDVADIMKAHQFKSVMVVTDYYRETGTRLALSHEGIAEVQKAHAGKFQKDDALKVGLAVVELYQYVGKVYILPAAEKAKAEAQAGEDKIKAEAEKAKKKVDDSLDSLVK